MFFREFELHLPPRFACIAPMAQLDRAVEPHPGRLLIGVAHERKVSPLGLNSDRGIGGKVNAPIAQLDRAPAF